jgi:hypothetical protein
MSTSPGVSGTVAAGTVTEGAGSARLIAGGGGRREGVNRGRSRVIASEFKGIVQRGLPVHPFTGGLSVSLREEGPDPGRLLSRDDGLLMSGSSSGSEGRLGEAVAARIEVPS